MSKRFNPASGGPFDISSSQTPILRSFGRGGKCSRLGALLALVSALTKCACEPVVSDPPPAPHLVQQTVSLNLSSCIWDASLGHLRAGSRVHIKVMTKDRGSVIDTQETNFDASSSSGTPGGGLPKFPVSVPDNLPFEISFSAESSASCQSCADCSLKCEPKALQEPVTSQVKATGSRDFQPKQTLMVPAAPFQCTCGSSFQGCSSPVYNARDEGTGGQSGADDAGSGGNSGDGDDGGASNGEPAGGGGIVGSESGLRNYACGFALANVSGNICENGRTTRNVRAANLNDAISACLAVQPADRPYFCAVLDSDGAAPSDASECQAAPALGPSGNPPAWRPGRNCCRFEGETTCPPSDVGSGGSSGAANTGGANNSGGATNTGGASNSGGTTNSGGVNTGGASNSGGAANAGGASNGEALRNYSCGFALANVSGNICENGRNTRDVQEPNERHQRLSRSAARRPPVFLSRTRRRRRGSN